MRTFLSLLFLFLLPAVPVTASWVLFEDFDDISDWTDSNSILSTAVDPIDGGGNSVGVLGGTSGGQFATKDLFSTISAANSDVVTVFFRMAVNDTNPASDTVSTTLMLSSDSGNGFAEAGPLVSIKDGVEITTREAGVEGLVSGGLSNLTWYNVWVVADMDTWGSTDDIGDVDVYVSTGAAPGTPTNGDAVFRRGQANTTLDSLELVRGGRVGDLAYYDDIYIDTTGQNLTLIPEPSSLVLTALAFLSTGLMVRKKRQR